MSQDPFFSNSMDTSEAQHLFRSAIDHADCIVARLDTKGRITFVNDFGSRFFSTSPDDLHGKPFIDLLMEADVRPGIDRPGMDRKCLEETVLQFPGDHRQICLHLKDEKGNLAHSHWQLSHHRGPDQSIIGKIAIGMPSPLPSNAKSHGHTASYAISDLFAPTATDASPIVLTSANYRFMWEKSSVLHYILDFDGIVLYVNDGVTAASGFDKDDVIGKSVFDLTPAEAHGDVTRRLERMRRFLDAHDPPPKREDIADIRIKILTRTGETRTILFSPSRRTITDASGRPLGFHVAGIDITELEAVNQDLRASEEKYRSFFDNQSIINVIVDFDGTILDLNDAVTSMHGCKKSDLVGVNIFDLMPPESGSQYRLNIERTMALSLADPQATTIKVETADRVVGIPTPTGVRYSLINKHVAVTRKGGRPEAFLSSNMDVTQLETARLELVAHRDRLEVLVEERTEALKVAQAELVKQERLAALGHLTAIAA